MGEFNKVKQRIPKSQKTKAWYEEVGKYYKDNCENAIDRAEAIKLYRLANGEIDETDYVHVTNPLNTTRFELQGYPAKLANYDIISPNVRLMLGEKAKRFFDPIVYAVNSNWELEGLKKEELLMINELQKIFINEAIQLGMSFDEETTTKLEEIQNKVKNMPDELAIMGQQALEYIICFNDLPREFRKGFYDFLCLAMVFSYKDVIKDETHYEIISPINVRYLCSPHMDFIEDGEAVTVHHRYSLSEIYDRFQTLPEFDKELKEFLEFYDTGIDYGMTDGYYYGLSDIDLQGQLFKNLFGQLPSERFNNGIDVEHIVFRGATKEGKLTVTDLFGNQQILYVTEDYKPEPGENIEWEWVDEIHEVYCIGDRYYIGGRAIPTQRGRFNRPNKAKLLYNGRNLFSRHTVPLSLVKKGETYQKNVNIIKYRAEETLLKNLGNIVLFPLGLIPNKEGWDEYKLMYYVRAFSFLFFDDSKSNAAQIVSALKSLNVDITQHLIESYNIVQLIKNEWDQVCGFSPQRKADVSPSAGLGTTNAALGQSYTMSEEYYLEYEEFENREYTGLLELSKYAFNKGKQATYIKTNGQKAFLNINGTKYVNAELGVFVKNGARTLEKLKELKANVQPFIQNGLGGGGISRLIESDNFAEIHQLMDKADAALEARLQADRETQLAIQQSQEAITDKQLNFDKYSEDLKSATDIQVALIQQGMKIVEDMQKLEKQKGPDYNEKLDNYKDSLQQNSLELIKNATKLKEIASRERMNKDNNRTALLNKTAGE
jgi:hypothetical protein